MSEEKIRNPLTAPPRVVANPAHVKELELMKRDLKLLSMVAYPFFPVREGDVRSSDLLKVLGLHSERDVLHGVLRIYTRAVEMLTVGSVDPSQAAYVLSMCLQLYPSLHEDMAILTYKYTEELPWTDSESYEAAVRIAYAAWSSEEVKDVDAMRQRCRNATWEYLNGFADTRHMLLRSWSESEVHMLRIYENNQSYTLGISPYECTPRNMPEDRDEQEVMQMEVDDASYNAFYALVMAVLDLAINIRPIDEYNLRENAIIRWMHMSRHRLRLEYSARNGMLG